MYTGSSAPVLCMAILKPSLSQRQLKKDVSVHAVHGTEMALLPMAGSNQGILMLLGICKVLSEVDQPAIWQDATSVQLHAYEVGLAFQLTSLSRCTSICAPLQNSVYLDTRLQL